MRYGEVLKIRATAIWNVLVEFCGANPDDEEFFVNNALAYSSFREYRFQGSLGFGGTIHFGVGSTPHVSYYKEHHTEDRWEIWEKTNKALATATKDLV